MRKSRQERLFLREQAAKRDAILAASYWLVVDFAWFLREEAEMVAQYGSNSEVYCAWRGMVHLPIIGEGLVGDRYHVQPRQIRLHLHPGVVEVARFPVGGEIAARDHARDLNEIDRVMSS